MIESSVSWYIFRCINVGVMVYLVVTLWRRYGKPALIDVQDERHHQRALLDHQWREAQDLLSSHTKIHNEFLISKQELLSKVIEWHDTIARAKESAQADKKLIQARINQRDLVIERCVYKDKALAIVIDEIMPELQKELKSRYQDESVALSALSKSITRMRGFE